MHPSGHATKRALFGLATGIDSGCSSAGLLGIKGFSGNRQRRRYSECITMQAPQDFEAATASAKITDQGDALLSFLTDKGHIAVLMRRVVLERLFEQTKSELQRVPRSSRRR
jgi:hypothetical protein